MSNGTKFEDIKDPILRARLGDLIEFAAMAEKQGTEATAEMVQNLDGAIEATLDLFTESELETLDVIPKTDDA